jgi:hypothetical protein
MSASTLAAGSMTRPPLIKSDGGFDLSCAIYLLSQVLPNRLTKISLAISLGTGG